jgi:hypothetical protein
MLFNCDLITIIAFEIYFKCWVKNSILLPTTIVTISNYSCCSVVLIFHAIMYIYEK